MTKRIRTIGRKSELDASGLALAFERKEIVRGLGFKQAELARLCKTSISAVCCELNGLTQRRGLREKITDVLGVNHERFWGGEERPISEAAARRKLILREKKITETKIAELLECSRSHVSNEICGRFNSKETRRRITELLGVSHEVFWGEAYGLRTDRARLLEEIGGDSRPVTAADEAEIAAAIELNRRVYRRVWACKSAGVTFAEIARRLEVSGAFVSAVMREADLSPWLRVGIAKIVRRDYAWLWGSAEPSL